MAPTMTHLRLPRDAASLDALRRTLDQAAPRMIPQVHASALPSVALPSSNAPMAPPAPLAACAQNVWAVPRPALPVLSRSEWRGLACFALALGCLWYLDMLTTAWALKNGGVEGGPVARFLVGHDMLPLLAAKIIGLALIILIAAKQIARKRTGLANWSLSMVGALSIGIVEWNLLGILVLAGVLG